MHNTLSMFLSRSKHCKHVMLKRLSRQRRDASTFAFAASKNSLQQPTIYWRRRNNDIVAPFSSSAMYEDEEDLSLDDEIEALAASFISLEDHTESEHEDLRALRQQRLRMEHSSLDLELGDTSAWDLNEDLDYAERSLQETNALEEDYAERSLQETNALEDEIVEEDNPLEFPAFPEGSPAAEMHRREQQNGSSHVQRKHQPVLSPLDLLEQLSLDPDSQTQTQPLPQHDPLSYVGPAVESKEEEMKKVQLRLECEAQREAVEKYQKLTTQTRNRKDYASLNSLQKLILRWYQPVRNEIDEHQQRYVRKNKQRTENDKDKRYNRLGYMRYGPRLALVEPEKLAVLAMHEMLTMSILGPSENEGGAGGCPVVVITTKLGRAVEQEVLLQRVLKKSRDEERAKEAEKVAAEMNTEVAAFAKETLEQSDGKAAKLPTTTKKDDDEEDIQPYNYAESRLAAYLKELDRDEKNVNAKNRRSIAFAVRRARQVLNAEEWNIQDIIHVGSILLQAVLEQATFRLPDGTVQPAFRMEKRWRKQRNDPRRPGNKDKFKCTNYIRVHDALWKLAVTDEFESIAATTTRHKPMVVPPESWTSPNHGGYAWLKTELIRFHGCQMQSEALDEADLTTIYDGLNALGREPWVINKTLLDVANQCWEENIPLGDIPSRTDFELPPEPTPVSSTRVAEEGDPDYDEDRVNAQKKQWGAELKLYKEAKSRYRRVLQKNQDLFSLRCSAQLKLGQAKQFQDYEEIYFPYNMDFRGRAYPVPPHLSNVGSDLCRGMLKFAKAKPLGKKGLFWLQVHLANLAGKDKMNFDDRAQYTMDNMQNVRDSVNDPFGKMSDLPEGERPWWMGLDDPFQGLATCHEIVNAIDSGDPENYLCALPVHMDGSCNGLQHYAALGLDVVGGTAVNLCKDDEPQDVYIGVMDEVINRVAEEAERELDIDEEALAEGETLSKKQKKALKRNRAAKLVNGLIDRGVVKRTVMTSVYGVTYIGARQQIQEKIEEKLEEQGRDLDELNWAVFAASGYLAEVTMNVIGDLFTGAKETMNWLTQCARLISSKGYPVAWMTPLGLPAIQPYRQKRVSKVVTALAAVNISEYSDDLPIHKSRSVSAFPPNYIHSLDSTHMLMTALEMDRRGLSFSAVHDSFWTHACDIDEMNDALREQFVELYSQPLLEELKQCFETRYPDITFPDLPEKGELDLEEVKEAKFFFQ